MLENFAEPSHSTASLVEQLTRELQEAHTAALRTKVEVEAWKEEHDQELARVQAALSSTQFNLDSEQRLSSKLAHTAQLAHRRARASVALLMNELHDADDSLVSHEAAIHERDALLRHRRASCVVRRVLLL